MHLTLRTVHIPDKGTFGTLYGDGRALAYSVERPWYNNQPSISCIPAGTYRLEPRLSPRWGKRFALVNPDLGVSIDGATTRTHILIHPANLPEELEGCLAFGQNWMPKWGVTNSRKTVEYLEHLLGLEHDRTHTIEILRAGM